MNGDKVNESVESMGKVKKQRERDYRMGRILRRVTAITAPKSFKSKAEVLKFTGKKLAAVGRADAEI